MITSADTPEPTAASTRGATPNTSLPVGRSGPLTGWRVGANSTMPTLSQLSHTSTRCVGRPMRSPPSRYTVPSASHGTFSTAPAR